MAKRKLGIPLLLTTALAGTGFGVFQDAKVAELEKRVKLLDDRLAKVERYVRAQASSINAFGASLDSAVKKGYTAGINYESRHVLVGAWRKIVEAAAKNAPVRATLPSQSVRRSAVTPAGP